MYSIVDSKMTRNIKGPMGRFGFTLVEIMVVVGVILIVLTLALPPMLRSRMHANEVSAISHCRLISNACQAYYSNVIQHTYPSGLDDLIVPILDPPYIDSILASGEKQGYNFTYDLVNEDSFTLRANPRNVGRTGNRYFYVDETGVIRNAEGGEAGPDDDPVSG